MQLPMKSAAGLALALAVLSLASAASAQTQWDLATNYPAGAFHTRNIVQFAADVDKATGGSLKMAVHPGGTIIKHTEIKRAVGEGRAAAGEVLISLAADEAPVYGVELDSFPGHRIRRRAQALRRSETVSSKGNWTRKDWSFCFRCLGHRKAFMPSARSRAIDDLKGLKFRTYNAMTKRIAELAGAQPTQIEVPDLAAAFASGRVDVMITSASSGVQTKAEEYLTHYIDSQAWLPRNMVFANKAAFERLSAAEKKAVSEAARAAEERGWNLSIEEMTVKTKALKDAGITVLTPTPELKSGMAKIGDTIAKEWAASAGADGEAMLAAYRK